MIVGSHQSLAPNIKTILKFGTRFNQTYVDNAKANYRREERNRESDFKEVIFANP